MSHASVHTLFISFFFFNDTAPTEIYTLSLHDALPISGPRLDQLVVEELVEGQPPAPRLGLRQRARPVHDGERRPRSEEHTSELQSQSNLVCRLLLEKKKK